MTATRLDTNKAEAFAERLLDILNSGAIALAMSLGHRTKLLDAMENLPPEGKVRQNWTTFSSPGFGIANFSFLAGKTSYLLITKLGLLTIKMLVLPRLSNFVQFHWTPSTSRQIADIAGLNERYVREWLAIMVTSRFVDYDRANKTYYLPPEHAAFLTRSASSDNIATFAQYIAQLGSVEDQIVECFHRGERSTSPAFKSHFPKPKSNELPGNYSSDSQHGKKTTVFNQSLRD